MTVRPRRVLCVVGTRPEAVKMAPVITALRQRGGVFETFVLSTGQHGALLDEALRVFSLSADANLHALRQGQALEALTTRMVEGVAGHLRAWRPDVVVAQGDTSSVLATVMACFLERVAFAHVEAGLRTGRLDAPWPEEFNRRIASLGAAVHFAPTDGARRHLLAEGIAGDRIHVVGNTVVDALEHLLGATDAPALPFGAGEPFLLLTCHRRESLGNRMEGILRAVRDFAIGHPGWRIWYPVHPNPAVAEASWRLLDGLPNVLLSPPLGHVEFLHALRRCAFAVTDSGGVQEEAATLGVPCLVLRETTERPEGVEAGVCRLIGTAPERIVEALERLATDSDERSRMAVPTRVFGDGRAGERIAEVLGGQVPVSP